MRRNINRLLLLAFLISLIAGRSPAQEVSPGAGGTCAALGGDLSGTCSAGTVNKISGTSPGTGVVTAFGLNVGSAGALVVNGGALGTATATSINKVAITAPATGATLTIADGKTLTANNSLTLAGTDGTTLTGPTTSATLLSTAGATFQGTPTNPTGTTSTSGVMMGIGSTCKITPVNSTRVFFWIQGTMNNGTASDGANLQLAYGTGTAPVNGAAATGTNPYTGAKVASTLLNNANTAGLDAPFHASGIATGLSTGTQIWFDANLAAITGGTATMVNVSCGAYEM